MVTALRVRREVCNPNALICPCFRAPRSLVPACKAKPRRSEAPVAGASWRIDGQWTNRDVYGPVKANIPELSSCCDPARLRVVGIDAKVGEQKWFPARPLAA